MTHVPGSEDSMIDKTLPVHRGGPLRVLVCDDNVDLATTQTLLLEDAGHIAEAVFGGEEALHKLQTFKADVLLLDIAMPGMDGIEVCRTLRASAAWNHLKIVAQTGQGDRDMLRRAAESGFDRLLVKPVELTELLALLDDIRREIRRVK